MPVRTLIVRASGEPDLVGRTVRALAAVGVAAEDAGVDLARALAANEEPIWLVRAGSWPMHSGPMQRPPPSATGRPIVALGCVNSSRRDASQRPASVYLDVEPALELARRLVATHDFDAAVGDLLVCERWRVVRFCPLDVSHDPGLRVVQVVTSLQRGGAGAADTRPVEGARPPGLVLPARDARPTDAASVRRTRGGGRSVSLRSGSDGLRRSRRAARRGFPHRSDPWALA